MNLPSTSRFFIVRDPNRRGINGSPSSIMEIMYRATPISIPAEFAHCWLIKGWGPKYDGRYQINRSDVAIANEYWDSNESGGYESLEAMLAHLEATFVEGVPHCKPD